MSDHSGDEAYWHAYLEGTETPLEELIERWRESRAALEKSDAFEKLLYARLVETHGVEHAEEVFAPIRAGRAESEKKLRELEEKTRRITKAPESTN